MAVANDIPAIMKQSAQVLEAAGGAIAAAAGGEGQVLEVLEDEYKVVTKSKLWRFLVRLFNSPDDPSPPGYMMLKSTESKGQSLPKKLVRRSDDHNTEPVTETAVDNGNDQGIYTFYSDMDVLGVEIPL